MIASRRRFIKIAATFAGFAVVPARRGFAASELRLWRGVALGADCEIQLYHPDAQRAEQLIAACVAEARRLETVFSLYRRDSALCRLNRDAVLDDPPPDLLRLLSETEVVHRLTDGTFDPTVQPLWNLYAAHFEGADADPAGPAPAKVAAALNHVGWRRVAFDEARVTLAPGMGLTFNGIAQGYITDRVCDLLRREGVGHTMVDMGELRALDTRPDGLPWRVGLENAKREVKRSVEISSRAVATSAGAATVLDAAGRFTHLFDPRTGSARPQWSSVSVVAKTASMADGLSTAFSMLSLEKVRRMAAGLNEVNVYVTDEADRMRAL
ncbi:MAG TPA: FAD:protein FMN transferase [Hyphomicrobium sp.]